MSHCPLKAWCPFCVMGKGTERPHMKGGDLERGSPIVFADFLHMKADGTYYEDG